MGFSVINIVLFEPEIPPNTGNIIRLASNTGCRLHLIHPLGFSLDEKRLRRAGLDYHEHSVVLEHQNWEAFLAACAPTRISAFSTKGARYYTEISYESDDYLLFGPETRGLPGDLLSSPRVGAVLRLPMLEHSRSLNLANTVAVVVYEAWRQLGFINAKPAS